MAKAGFLQHRQIGHGEEVVEISASKAQTFDNYTLITYTVKSVSKPTLWGNALVMEPHHRGENAFYAAPMFFGADILRGLSRTIPLEYPRPSATDSGREDHFVLTGGGLHGGFTNLQAGDEVTIPVLYPPTSDETLTIDCTREAVTPNPAGGWRITGIPNEKQD